MCMYNLYFIAYLYNKHDHCLVVIEKEYMEQLAEMTRLLFKLSEVKNIFSKAQIEHLPSPEDPKQALIQFLEVFFIY